MRQVIVTGGLGFIGSHLVERLLEEGSRVTIIDNQTSSVVEPRFFPGCRVVTESLRDWRPRRPYHEIYHLASPVGPLGVLRFPGRVGYEIVADAQVVAHWALRMQARLLFTSTSELYGRGGVFREDVVKHVGSQISARLAYGVGKLLSEIDLLNLAAERPLWLTIVRPFNIAGPRQSAQGGFVLPRFIEQALAGKPITVYGRGSQVRSLTHVADVVQALIKLMRSPKARGEIFNLGNPRNQITILELARLVKKMSRSVSPIRFVDPQRLHGKRFAEAFDKVPDMSKMEKLFGWSPTIGVERIVSDTLEYYRRDR